MMRNKEVLNEIRKQSRTLIEEKRDKFVKQSLLSDEFIDMMQRNRKPFDLLMSYYQCAIMEIETKFKVLNEEYSLEYDKNPIEGIKSRIKSYDSLLTRYTGGEMNTQLKPWDSAKLHFAFCFPDTYEVGMSHLGMKILYAAMNQQPDMLCERAFMPWVDMMDLMKQEKVPLFTLESRSPLSAFDVVGFTLQYEMSYSNILAMLELGGIPLLRENRREEDPIVVAGGPCAFNPEPLADFIDAFMVGDGEEQILDLNRVWKCGNAWS